MLYVGIVLGLAATLIEHFYASRDYWRPVYLFTKFPFEDFFYGFIYGGISAELFELFLNKSNSKKRVYKTHKLLLAYFLLFSIFSFVISVNILHFNSIIAHITPPISIGLVAGIVRRDLFRYQIYNGVFLTILTIITFRILLLIEPQLFTKYWYISNLTGIFILDIPIEELLFAFAVGFASGTVYEMLLGYSEVKSKAN
jgi:hypothetical protein